MKKLKKKLLKSEFVINLAAFLIAGYIKLVGSTIRWKVVNKDLLTQYMGKPVIISFWHGRLLMVPFHTPRTPANVLISNHRDGELIARVQRHFGYGAIRGSSSKGGAAAIREILKYAKNNQALIITPDGPRGPARKVSGNIVKLSKKLALPIIPVTYSCSRHKLANSWDSFMVAKPFGRGVFLVGDVIPPENAENLEEILNKLTDEADAFFKTI